MHIGSYITVTVGNRAVTASGRTERGGGTDTAVYQRKCTDHPWPEKIPETV